MDGNGVGILPSKVWGALQSFDPEAEHIVHSGWNSAFDYIDKHAATPSVEELAKHRLPELDTRAT